MLPDRPRLLRQARQCKLPAPAILAGLALANVSPAHAATVGGLSGATVSASVALFVALCLLLAAIHYRRRLGDATAYAAELERALTRERALIDTSPEAILCWDLAAGDQKLTDAAIRMLGIQPGTVVGAEQVAAAVGEQYRAKVEADVGALIERGVSFDALVEGNGNRRLVLCGRVVPQAGGRHIAVLWIRDDTHAARALDEARRSADGFRRMLDGFPFPVWRRRRDLTLDYVNPTYRDAVESDPDADASEVPEIAAGAIRDKGRALARQASESRKAERESHHIVAAGARRLMEITESPVGGDGAIAGFAIDRTELEELRSDLSRHIASHEEVLHNLGTAIAIFGPDRRLEFFNNAYMRLWGLDEPFLSSRPALTEILEELRESRRIPEHANFPQFKASQNALFTSLLDPMEEMVHLPDDTTLRAVTAPHPFGGLLMTWEDVTASLALERSYNTLIAVQKETLDNLYEGVAVIGGDGRLQLSNPAFGRIWQMSEDELAAAPHISQIVERMRELLVLDGEWEDRKKRLIALLTDRDGRSGRVERADESVIDYATVPLPDGAVLLSYVDVSDSHRVEQFLRERNEALETADRLKSEFIANVSYELRTPLNTIIGFAEILDGEYFGDLNPRQMEYSKGILESSQRLLALINDILDLATIESGHMTLELGTVDLHELLTSVLGLTRERVIRKNLRLDFDCPEDIGNIMADERRLKQALFNILSNSVKFTPEDGEITVSARRLTDSIVITFTDTGIGIPEEDHQRIFAKFERGSQPEARRSGAGLGLSLVQSFIELHGGNVELESEPGVGTKVVCRLPARRHAEEPARLAGE